MLHSSPLTVLRNVRLPPFRVVGCVSKLVLYCHMPLVVGFGEEGKNLIVLKCFFYLFCGPCTHCNITRLFRVTNFCSGSTPLSFPSTIAAYLTSTRTLPPWPSHHATGTDWGSDPLFSSLVLLSKYVGLCQSTGKPIRLAISWGDEDLASWRLIPMVSRWYSPPDLH